MEKYNLFIAENDERYVTNLMYYISEKYSNKFNTTCFTDYTVLDEHINKNDKVDIILINPDLLSENKSKYNNKTVILLTDDVDRYKEYSCIKKYQSAEKICSDLIKIYENKVKEQVENKSKENTSIFTFFSPLGGIGTSTLAISTAYSLAKNNKRVLYLNLENIQSTNIFIREFSKSKYDFVDLTIAIKNRSTNIIDILAQGINKFNDTKLYYFNSIESILDIEELTSEDIKILVESIEKSNLFDFVIIDIPSVLDTKYYYLFQKSVSVIVAIGQDKRSNYKIDTLLTQLDNTQNFLFVVNKFNKYKERLIPKVIAVNSKPIIETIDFYEEIDGNYIVDELLSFPTFNRKVDELINNNIFNH